MPCLLQLVTACAMQAFHGLFSAQPSPACLPAELNAQIITVSVVGRGLLGQGDQGRGSVARPCSPPLPCPQALYDYVPSESDLQPMLAWLAVMERAHINLVGCDLLSCWAGGRGPSTRSLPGSLVLARLEALGSRLGLVQQLLLFWSSPAWKWPGEGVAGARLVGAAALGGRGCAGALLAPPVLQAAEGAVLGAPAPTLRGCHDLPPVTAPPGAVSHRTDPQGTCLRIWGSWACLGAQGQARAPALRALGWWCIAH